MHAERRRLFPLADGIIDARQMGTPKGLRRVADRLGKALGPLLLGIYVCAAKRGKGSLAFSEWVTWDAAAGKEADRKLQPPPVGWLAAFMTVYKPAGYSREINSYALLLVTRHAVVRLAQRDGGQIAVLEPDWSDKPRLVCKTILSADMVGA